MTIRNGRRTQPPMPAFGERLSDRQIADVIAYLATLPVGPRNFGPGAGMMEGIPDTLGGQSWADWIAWALIIILTAVEGALRVSRAAASRRDGSRAVAILEERYARGEIDRDEFEDRRATLGRKR